MEDVKSCSCTIDDLKTELCLALPGTEDLSEGRTRGSKRSNEGCDDEEIMHVAEAKVVGWPPVRSYRKMVMNADIGGMNYVKVSMDGGAPNLSKVDLKMYKGYEELRKRLENLFKCFPSFYAITYEDRDGDWTLVGDVPWGMFLSTCKRLGIMHERQRSKRIWAQTENE